MFYYKVPKGTKIYAIKHNTNWNELSTFIPKTTKKDSYYTIEQTWLHPDDPESLKIPPNQRIWIANGWVGFRLKKKYRRKFYLILVKLDDIVKVPITIQIGGS
ncbi:hypothetical protein HSE3_gp027 [Bacillus phage vB_BceM-HSE3]|nr:hypothetical protein HSE3_gp027 [Bacillus phage vB_BceM-HSE3]